MSTLVPSLVRTWTPLLVGFLAGIPIINAAGVTSEQVSAFLTAGLSAVYYLVVRLVEQHAPQAGWLLGLPQQPVYREPAE